MPANTKKAVKKGRKSKADSVSNNAVNVYEAIALHLMDHLLNLNVIRVTDDNSQTVSQIRKARSDR